MTHTVLIIDDSEATRTRLRGIFRASRRFAVIGEADSGVAGVRLYQELKPDLVLLAIVMPTQDGIETLRQIARTDPDARVMMVSAAGQEGLVMESLVAGARDFVLKPFDGARVLRTADRLLS